MQLVLASLEGFRARIIIPWGPGQPRLSLGGSPWYHQHSEGGEFDGDSFQKCLLFENPFLSSMA